jgi:hypothetical protein
VKAIFINKFELFYGKLFWHTPSSYNDANGITENDKATTIVILIYNGIKDCQKR